MPSPSVQVLEHRALRGRSPWAPEPVIFLRVRADEPRLARAVLDAAVRLQRLAGLDVGEGDVRPAAAPGEHVVTYPFIEPESGFQAGLEAVELAQREARDEADEVARAARLRLLAHENAPGFTTASLVAEARRRGIPVLPLDAPDHVQLGHGARQRRISGTLTSRTSGLGMLLADDKERTKRLLHTVGVPVPRGESVLTLRGAREVAFDLRYPVVLKPLVGNHGRGITTNVRDEDELARAFDRAKEAHPRVLVERHLLGHDYRVLLVEHRVVAAARREPAQVVGDGASTVRHLVDLLNADPHRGVAHERPLTRVTVDDDTLALLARQGLALDSVPASGQRVVLKSAANISNGGTATDVTDELHPLVRAACERASRIFGMDVTGIDIVAPTLQRPLDETGGGVVEVNASPGLRMHLHPSHGAAHSVARDVLDHLFPPGDDGRIPLAAVTGTNGKTTTTRVLAHILQQHGHRVGLTGTSGVEVEGRVLLEGDYSGPAGARTVLREPTVDAAVMEVARGGILRRGLGFDACDVGVLLNVSRDHLGESGVATVEDLARVKGVVLDAVKPAGTAVLNADDPLVLAHRARLSCRVALFALDGGNEAFAEHVRAGGLGVTVAEGVIVLRRGERERPLVDVRDVPVTMEGRAPFNVQNVLAAVAAASAMGVADATICGALRTFNPTFAQLPGRLNVLDVGKVRVVVDYGHNPAAVRALGELLPHLAPGRRINVAHAAGNRLDEDIRALGGALAGVYHHVILADPDTRDRPLGQSPALLREGLLAAGFPDAEVRIVLDEGEAIEAALDAAQDGDLVVLQVDDITSAINRVKARQAGVPPAPPRHAPAFT